MTFLVFVEMMIAPEKKLTTCLNSNIGQRVGIYLIHPILLPCRFEWLLSASLELYLFFTDDNNNGFLVVAALT